MKSIKSDSDEQKKVVSFFQEIIEVTPSVAAPGDTNPSDATGLAHYSQSLAVRAGAVHVLKRSHYSFSHSLSNVSFRTVLLFFLCLFLK